MMMMMMLVVCGAACVTLTVAAVPHILPSALHAFHSSAALLLLSYVSSSSSSAGEKDEKVGKTWEKDLGNAATPRGNERGTRVGRCVTTLSNGFSLRLALHVHNIYDLVKQQHNPLARQQALIEKRRCLKQRQMQCDVRGTRAVTKQFYTILYIHAQRIVCKILLISNAQDMYPEMQDICILLFMCVFLELMGPLFSARPLCFLPVHV